MHNINRHTVLYIVLLLLGMVLQGCQKYSDEDYEGQWQLLEIAAPDGTNPQDVKAQGIYWRMQLGILQIISTGMSEDADPGEVIAQYHVSDGKLCITAIYKSEREADILITEPEAMLIYLPYGLTEVSEDFVIETISSSRLVLVSGNKRLTFRKF
ncbi:MAG: lipocalin-like domain-containing protein [Bacteroidaceae bacterium]|nr:lipocalin-like domain-containing protein [Bacteroidaceae bacterium]